MALLQDFRGKENSRRFDADALQSSVSPLIVAAVIIALLYWARIFFITFFSALALAFILEPFVGLLMRLRAPRSLASFFVCSFALLALYFTGLGVYTQVSSLVEDYQDTYIPRVAELVDKAQKQLRELEQAAYKFVVPARQREQQQEQVASRKKTRKQPQPAQPQPAQPTPTEAPPETAPAAPIPEVRIRTDNPLGEYLYRQLSSLYQIALMASFVPFLIYFMLSWRDHVYRNFLLFFEGEDRAVAAKSLEGIAGMVRAFVVGNFAIGVLLAAASSLAFWKMDLPYPLLLGPVSGFLSLVPYIGLPLALVPPILITLAALPGLTPMLIIAAIVTLLHLIALNLLYPKLVGSRVHLNPLVVTVALMFWGFLWDAAGLVLAIPLTAGIKAVLDNIASLRPYGRLLGD